MAVKIRLLRMGKIRNPQYRIVVADSRTKRDGRAIEFVGVYQPKEDPSVIEVKSERVQYWLSVGAQPSEAVQRLLELTGDWQKFKGLPAPAPMKVAEPKPDKRALFDAALKETEGEPAVEATTPRKKAAPKKAAAEAESPEAPAAPAADTTETAPAADATAAEASEEAK